MFESIKKIVLSILDFFYTPFAKFLPVRTYRYLACGGSNAVLNITLYPLSYNLIFHKHDLNLFNITAIPAIYAAYAFAFIISFPIGFILSSKIVFPESELHGRVQLFRYAITTIMFIILTNVFIYIFHVTPILNLIQPSVSYIFIVIIISVMSYFLQRAYTFKINEIEKETAVK